MREQLSKLWCTEAYHLIRLAKHNLQIKIVWYEDRNLEEFSTIGNNDLIQISGGFLRI